jgi:hypothetical protein
VEDEDGQLERELSGGGIRCGVGRILNAYGERVVYVLMLAMEDKW